MAGAQPCLGEKGSRPPPLLWHQVGAGVWRAGQGQPGRWGESLESLPGASLLTPGEWLEEAKGLPRAPRRGAVSHSRGSAAAWARDAESIVRGRHHAGLPPRSAPARGLARGCPTSPPPSPSERAWRASGPHCPVPPGTHTHVLQKGGPRSAPPVPLPAWGSKNGNAWRASATRRWAQLCVVLGAGGKGGRGLPLAASPAPQRSTGLSGRGPCWRADAGPPRRDTSCPADARGGSCQPVGGCQAKGCMWGGGGWAQAFPAGRTGAHGPSQPHFPLRSKAALSQRYGPALCARLPAASRPHRSCLA